MSYRRSLLLLQAVLGLGLALASTTPAKAGTVGMLWQTIAASADGHTCGIGTGGYVYCWGTNAYGELGNTAVPTSFVTGPGGGNSNVPVVVRGLPAPATAIAVGSDDVSCAVLNSGAVYCWGYGKYGQLGNGSASPGVNNVPMPVQGLPAAATSVAVGQYHACATLSTGSVACWGTNQEPYELGNASIAQGAKVSPTVVPGVVRAISVSAGGMSTCALVHSPFALKGQPWPTGPQCWGDNYYGQAGQPVQAAEIPATNDESVPWDITSISVEGLFTCATSSSEGALCWGYDRSVGGLGDNFTCAYAPPNNSASGYCYLPQSVQFASSPGTGATSIAAGGGADCAVYASGTYGAGSVYCWGWNGSGQAGLPAGNPGTLGRAVGVQQLWGPAMMVATGLYQSCAIVDFQYHVQCWGNNDNGQLGNGTYTSSYLPVTVL